MTDGRQMDDWNHTASLMAMVRNCAFGNKRRVSPEDLHPFTKTKVRTQRRQSKADMRQALNEMVGIKEQGRVDKGEERDNG